MIWTLALLLIWPAQDVQAEEWIEQLGSEDYKVREAATARPKKAGKAAVPALKRAAGSKVLEVSARVRLILNEIALADSPLLKSERDASLETRRVLRDKKVTVNFDSFSIREFVTHIGAYCGLDTYVGPDVQESGLSLSLSGVSVESALTLALSPLDAHFVVYHGIVVVTNKCDPLDDLPGPSLKVMASEKMTSDARETVSALSREARFDLDSFPLEDGVHLLQSISKRRFVIEPGARRTAGSVPVTLKLKPVPLHVTLRLMCHQAGADWEIDDDGTIRISEKK